MCDGLYTIVFPAHSGLLQPTVAILLAGGFNTPTADVVTCFAETAVEHPVCVGCEVVHVLSFYNNLLLAYRFPLPQRSYDSDHSIFGQASLVVFDPSSRLVRALAMPGIGYPPQVFHRVIPVHNLYSIREVLRGQVLYPGSSVGNEDDFVSILHSPTQSFQIQVLAKLFASTHRRNARATTFAQNSAHFHLSPGTV
jgi:hypothetical protein